MEVSFQGFLLVQNQIQKEKLNCKMQSFPDIMSFT